MVASPDGGILLVAGGNREVVLRVGPRGDLSLFAGGAVGFGGDGGPAVQASLGSVDDIALMPDRSVLIADSNNCRVRRVWPSGVITSVAGSGPTTCIESTGDGGPATAAQLQPFQVAPTADGGFLVADGASGTRIRRVAPDGTISAAALNGDFGPPQPGRPALESPSAGLNGLLARADGGFLFADSEAVYRVRPDGILVRKVANPDPFGGLLLLSDEGSIYWANENGRIWELGAGRARNLIAGGRRAGYFGGEGDPAGRRSLSTSEVEKTADDDILLTERERVLLVARPDTPRLAIAVARESLPVLARHRLRFRLTRAAMVDVELRRGPRRMRLPSRPARAGLNTVTLPHVARGGPYTAYVGATAADGAVASDQLKVLVGGSLPATVARRAIVPQFLSSYDTPPPITRACRRFGPRRVDCVRADQDLEHPLRHVRCTTVSR